MVLADKFGKAQRIFMFVLCNLGKNNWVTMICIWSLKKKKPSGFLLVG